MEFLKWESEPLKGVFGIPKIAKKTYKKHQINIPIFAMIYNNILKSISSSKMSRKTIKSTVNKNLYARSGNECAFPDCKTQLYDKNGTNISEICHIEAASEGGARFNKNSNDEYRSSYDNLILLCCNHHEEIDQNPEKYPVSFLKKMKANHETEVNKKIDPLEIINKNPSLISEVVEKLSHFSLEDDSKPPKDAPNIEEKIKYNHVIEYQSIIEHYALYDAILEPIYKELEVGGSSKKQNLLQYIKTLYLEEKKNYTIEQVRENADIIFRNIEGKLSTEVSEKTEILSYQEIRIGVLVVMVNAFMQCKILEKPK